MSSNLTQAEWLAIHRHPYMSDYDAYHAATPAERRDHLNAVTNTLISAIPTDSTEPLKRRPHPTTREAWEHEAKILNVSFANLAELYYDQLKGYLDETVDIYGDASGEAGAQFEDRLWIIREALAGFQHRLAGFEKWVRNRGAVKEIWRDSAGWVAWRSEKDMERKNADTVAQDDGAHDGGLDQGGNDAGGHDVGEPHADEQDAGHNNPGKQGEGIGGPRAGVQDRSRQDAGQQNAGGHNAHKGSKGKGKGKGQVHPWTQVTGKKNKKKKKNEGGGLMDL